MILRVFLQLVLLWAYEVQAKAVFAHFMVSNAQNYSLADWADDIRLAQAAHVDAFALNTAYNQNDGPQYDLAFQAAASAGFKLFFSFDYAGNGAWPMSQVISLLQKYGSNGAHYQYNGKAFVSTFEGPASAKDWVTIKSTVNCFFVPDWSSLGAKAALELEFGVADGLFAWSAWPWGNRDMDTFVDASYLTYLQKKPYMMPVSPMFYTNLPGFNKNWLWRGDSLWADRWTQVNYLQPEWVEIISWNDYGESHYIGPIKDKALGAMTIGRAPYDYVSNMPHDGFRAILPYQADMYVKNTTTITQEKLVYWYRKTPAALCNSGGTTGNTAWQLQVEFSPADVVQDRVFFSAFLASNADVTVSIGGASVAAKWTDISDNYIGHYHGSVEFGGKTGPVVVTISRNGQTVMSGTGVSISTSCAAGGMQNWNMWVGSAGGSASISATPTDLGKEVCVAGTSVGNFVGLCEFTCNLGYCPFGACQCTAMGKQKTLPKAQNVKGYPAAGLDDNYSGLCAFACNYGYCPAGVCVTGTKQPLTTPTVSPFTPDACTSGTGSSPFTGLCNYACNFGFCPRAVCTCLTQGPLHVPPEANTTITGNPTGGLNDYGLCTFACSRGYCPPGTCTESSSSGPGGPGRDGAPVIIDPTIWKQPVPMVSCIPPCVLVLPPYSLPTPTTISFPPITTTFTVKGQITSTTVVTVSFPLVTTTRIPVFNLNITASSVDHIIYTVTPSILPTTKITVYDDKTPIPITITSTPSGGTKTYPQISSTPRGVSFTSTTPPGPTCTSLIPGDCGDVCVDNCATCGLFGCGAVCPGCGGGWSEGGGGSQEGGCVGPSCPKNGEDFDEEGNDPCQKDVVTTTGLCPNGNYPVWMPDTASVSCDFSVEQAPDVITACQEEIDENLDESVIEAGQSQSCCPGSKRSVFDILGLLSPRQAPCGPDPDYPNNPPPAGQDHHEVFSCDYDEWPNVCANAQSAIVSRGKSPLMTYAGPNQRNSPMEEVTNPWYANKYHSGPKPKPNQKTGITELDGWGLTGCEVEEYPWGSSAPNRNPNRKKWNDQSVLRLIPEEENKKHGKFLQTWIMQKGNGNFAQAKGLIFSVSFVGKNNLPTGTSDADFWIDPSKRDQAEAKNICAIPYGVEFLFVHAAAVDAGERRYDPWWDDKLFDKTVGLYTNGKGETTKTVESKTVSHYCKFPSPGKKSWNPANNKWEQRLPATSWDRKRGNRYYSCDNYPGYTGPAMMRRRGRGRRSIVDMTADEIQELYEAGVNITISDGSIGGFDDVGEDQFDEDHLGEDEHDDDDEQDDMADLSGIFDEVVRPVSESQNNINNITALEKRRMSTKRAASGSFLDASAFQYLGCANANGDDCALPGVQCEDNAADDTDTYDTTTSSPPPAATTTTPVANTPAPTTTAAPVPTTPSADCAFWDELLGWHFQVYNIANWDDDLGEDNGGQGLLDNERGCGALTGWEWNARDGTTGASAWFYLPFFIKDGCVERAIASAGGPKISCVAMGVPDIKRMAPGNDTEDLVPVATIEPVQASPLPDASLGRYSYNGSTVPPPHDPYEPMVWFDPVVSASMITMVPTVSATVSILAIPTTIVVDLSQSI